MTNPRRAIGGFGITRYHTPIAGVHEKFTKFSQRPSTARRARKSGAGYTMRIFRGRSPTHFGSREAVALGARYQRSPNGARAGGVVNFFSDIRFRVRSFSFRAAACPRRLSALDCAACPDKLTPRPTMTPATPPACRRPLDSGAGVECAGSGKILTSGRIAKTQ